MMEKIHDRNALHYSKTQTHPASEENRHELCRNTKLSGIITDKCYSKWIFEEVHMQRLRTFYKYLLHFSVFLDKEFRQTDLSVSVSVWTGRILPSWNYSLGHWSRQYQMTSTPLRLLSYHSYLASVCCVSRHCAKQHAC